MKLKTTNIKGKNYVEVNERVRAFRSLPQFKDHSLTTIILNANDKECFIEAQVMDEKGRVIANGHAHELKNAGMVNKTSHIENCETSAVGRALGFLGIGVDTSVASAEEVQTAIAVQEGMEEPKKNAGAAQVQSRESLIKSNYIAALKTIHGEKIPQAEFDEAKKMTLEEIEAATADIYADQQAKNGTLV